MPGVCIVGKNKFAKYFWPKCVKCEMIDIYAGASFQTNDY